GTLAEVPLDLAQRGCESLVLVHYSPVDDTQRCGSTHMVDLLISCTPGPRNASGWDVNVHRMCLVCSHFVSEVSMGFSGSCLVPDALLWRARLSPEARSTYLSRHGSEQDCAGTSVRVGQVRPLCHRRRDRPCRVGRRLFRSPAGWTRASSATGRHHQAGP